MKQQTTPKSVTRRTTGDSDDLAHIVMKNDQMRGYVAGQSVKALCGKVWIPSRDYEGLPVCASCTREKERILAGMSGLN